VKEFQSANFRRPNDSVQLEAGQMILELPGLEGLVHRGVLQELLKDLAVIVLNIDITQKISISSDLNLNKETNSSLSITFCFGWLPMCIQCTPVLPYMSAFLQHSQLFV
jgi:hypothetical protein